MYRDFFCLSRPGFRLPTVSVGSNPIGEPGTSIYLGDMLPESSLDEESMLIPQQNWVTSMPPYKIEMPDCTNRIHLASRGERNPGRASVMEYAIKKEDVSSYPLLQYLIMEVSESLVKSLDLFYCKFLDFFNMSLFSDILGDHAKSLFRAVGMNKGIAGMVA
jgi:hypothetical protein